MQPDKNLQNEQLQPEEKQKLDQLALAVANAIKADRERQVDAKKDSDDFNPFDEVYNVIKNLFGEDVTIETAPRTGGSDNDSQSSTQENPTTEGDKIISVTPKDLKSHLDEYVVAQDHAKKVLSVAIFNHYSRLNNNTQRSKSNVLLVGPSGSGKTYLIERIAKHIDVPVAFGDATTLTQAGYVGEDVDSLVSTLYHKANRNIERAQQGIIFIDEFDKMVRKQSSSNSLDVGGVGVQQAILKMLEGSEVKIDGSNGPSPIPGMGKNKVINTKNILFICAGAFVGIEKIIKARVQPTRNKIGFSDENFTYSSEIADYNQLIQQVNSDDLIKFGFIPEVLGRIPVIAGLEKLSVENLVEIITSKRESTFKDFRLTFADFNVDLVFTKQAIEEIAKQTLDRQTGARGLRSIFENILLDSMFELPSIEASQRPKSIVFTKQIILDKGTPIYTNASLESIIDEEDTKLFEQINANLVGGDSNSPEPALEDKPKKASSKKAPAKKASASKTRAKASTKNTTKAVEDSTEQLMEDLIENLTANLTEDSSAKVAAKSTAKSAAKKPATKKTATKVTDKKATSSSAKSTVKKSASKTSKSGKTQVESDQTPSSEADK